MLHLTRYSPTTAQKRCQESERAAELDKFLTHDSEDLSTNDRRKGTPSRRLMLNIAPESSSFMARTKGKQAEGHSPAFFNFSRRLRAVEMIAAIAFAISGI